MLVKGVYRAKRTCKSEGSLFHVDYPTTEKASQFVFEVRTKGTISSPQDAE